MEKMVLVLVSERDLHGDGAACQPMLPVKKWISMVPLELNSIIMTSARIKQNEPRHHHDHVINGNLFYVILSIC